MTLRTVALWLTFALVSSCASSHAYSKGSEPAGPCNGRGVAVVVVLNEHELLLCENNAASATYAVALGKGGTGKQRRGDNKTPVGTYGIGVPRASVKFGTFIPVDYPTQSQREAGFTGSSIGIHGPDRSFTWAGWLTTRVDWTQGCIAVGSDEEMQEIASWFMAKKPRRVFLDG